MVGPILDILWAFTLVDLIVLVGWQYYQLRQKPFYGTEKVTIDCEMGVKIVLTTDHPTLTISGEISKE